MKIIGKIDRSNFIAQLTDYEVARMLGYYSDSSMPSVNRDGEKISVGMEYQVSEMYEACQSVKDTANEISKAIQTHERLIANLKKFNAAILPAAELIKAKEPKS